jgi:hypothetical protein
VKEPLIVNIVASSGEIRFEEKELTEFKSWIDQSLALNAVRMN